jgi:hypothetical protein
MRAWIGPARLAEGQLRERLGDLEADVHADQVHELERTHPKAAGHTADAVDLLRGRDALSEHAQALAAERAAAAVDQEAGPVGREDHALPHRLAGRAGELERAV